MAQSGPLGSMLVGKIGHPVHEIRSALTDYNVLKSISSPYFASTRLKKCHRLKMWAAISNIKALQVRPADDIFEICQRISINNKKMTSRIEK
jgi:hypothetical protein